MERPLTPRSAALVRALIARAFACDGAELQLGTLRLRPHQRSAASRLGNILDELGGALLADEAGLGKTYVALAVARKARQALIICPAALIPMWQRSCAAAGTSIPTVSYEALSRKRSLVPAHDLLILDEAHHARTPGTRRYRELSSLAAGARVLLLSATPIHNHGADLAALFALFLGARAWSMDDAELARFVVRRQHDMLGDASLPSLSAPELLEVGDDEDTLEAILALPPPLPPSDGGDGGALLTLGLVRQWASSDAAVIAALRKRLARAGSLIHALESGRYPTRGELAAWRYADDSVQLAFPELVSSAVDEPGPAIGRLLAAVRDHADALLSVLGLFPFRTSLDDVRVEHLRRLRRRHPGEKVVAFSQYTDTVLAFFHELRKDGRVAALTSQGGLVAGGPLSRREILARFAPRAGGLAAPREADRIEMLLTTDLLSEGMNVQDASVVVHLDLPWTAARMEQRVGRSRRIGAVHRRTAVYALAPPASAAAMTGIERRLREKLSVAARAIGAAGAILPASPAAPHSAENVVSKREALFSLLADWWRDKLPDEAREGAGIMAGIAASGRDGFLALAAIQGHPILFGAFDGEPVTDDPDALLPLVTSANGPDARADSRADAREMERAADLARDWLARRHAAHASGAVRSIAGSSRRVAMQRVARITARLPLHRRAALLPLAARARQAITTRFGVGAERVLGELAGASMPDEAWLQAVSAFGEALPRGPREGEAAPSRLMAVLVIRAVSARGELP
jgi:superfamily II DNA or RNA helicase